MDNIIYSNKRFKKIKDSRTYYVSKCGEVLNTNYNNTHKIRLLKKVKNRDGYFMLKVKKGEYFKYYSVHRLVAETYIPNPENKRVVNHIDGDKTNNHVNNLEWVTDSENVKHSYDLGLQKIKSDKEHHNSKKIYQFSKDGVPVKEWFCLMDILRELNYNIGHISACCNGKRGSANGYLWSFKPKLENSYKRICLECKISFTANRKLQKYCSRKCQNNSKYQKVDLKTKICLECGNSFQSAQPRAVVCSNLDCKIKRKNNKNKELYQKKLL